MDESVEYTRTATAAGTERIVATPHVELVNVWELPERVREVREALAEEGIELEVGCGGELKPQSVPALSKDAVETIAHGRPGRRGSCSRCRSAASTSRFVARSAWLTTPTRSWPSTTGRRRTLRSIIVRNASSTLSSAPIVTGLPSPMSPAVVFAGSLPAARTFTTMSRQSACP